MLAAAYFVGLLVGSTLAMPLGGLFNALLGLTFAIPFLGRPLAFAFNRLIRLTLVGKLASWAISASGLAVSYLLLARAFGPPHSKYQWAAVASASAIVVLDISWRVVMFQTFHVTTVDDIKEYLPAFLRARLHTIDADEAAVLVRQNFADVNFTAILQLLVAFGTLLFGLANLGVLATKTGAIPSLTDCLSVSFSFVSLAAGDTVTFVGPLWLILRFMAGVVLLVWAVAFVGFAIELLPKPARTQADLFEAYREDLARIVSEDDTSNEVSPQPAET
jgi:hypothetical protein